MGFKQNLTIVSKQIDAFIDKYSLLEVCIDRKLNRTLNKYLKDKDKNIYYILSRSNYKVLKAIEKKKELDNKEKNYETNNRRSI